MGQVAALVITVGGLPIAIPAWGNGAALVSLLAYSLNFAVVVHAARRRVGGSIRSYLVVTRADLRWLSSVRHRSEPAAVAA